MAICIECDEEYSDRRKALGYNTCLDCGDAIATQQILYKAKCTAPAYNKGAYQVISKQDVKDIGK